MYPNKLHKITTLWKFGLNWSSNLQENNERKNDLVAQFVCFQMPIKGFRHEAFNNWVYFFRGSCFSKCFILTTSIFSMLKIVSFIRQNNNAYWFFYYWIPSQFQGRFFTEATKAIASIPSIIGLKCSPVEIYNFLKECPLPRTKCLSALALSKTKHTCLQFYITITCEGPSNYITFAEFHTQESLLSR